MQIKFPNGVIHHCRPDTGRGFIEAGLAVEVIPEKNKFVPNPDVKWLAVRGPVTGGIEEPPYLFFHCKGCGEKLYASGPTAHKTTQVRHCQTVVSTVPSHVADEYARLRKLHDRAVIENKRKAEQKAKFKAAEQSALAAART